MAYEAVIRDLRRARKSDSIEQKHYWETSAFFYIRGVISAWADDDGIKNKEAYAMETLERIKELQLVFKNDELEKQEQQK